MVTEQLKGRGNTTTWFLFVARLDAGAHFVCTLLKVDLRISIFILPKTLKGNSQPCVNQRVSFLFTI